MSTGGKVFMSIHKIKTLSLVAIIFLTFANVIKLAKANEFINKEVNVYTYKSAAGVTSFSDIEPLELEFHRYKIDCYACQLDSLINWRTAKLYLTHFSKNINHAARINKIDPAFVRAIIHAESHFDSKAVSKQGAQGLMQLMPETAKYLGVQQPLNAEQNIYGGVKHLAHLLKKYRGDNKLAAAAYNAGEGAIKKYAGIPPFAETQAYVQRVSILHKRYKRYKRKSLIWAKL